jgi:hypothetical protein
MPNSGMTITVDSCQSQSTKQGEDGYPPALTENLTDRKLECAFSVLKELKQLSTLDLGNSQVTDAGVKDLQEALPRCRISR